MNVVNLGSYRERLLKEATKINEFICMVDAAGFTFTLDTFCKSLDIGRNSGKMWLKGAIDSGMVKTVVIGDSIQYKPTGTWFRTPGEKWLK